MWLDMSGKCDGSLHTLEIPRGAISEHHQNPSDIVTPQDVPTIFEVAKSTEQFVGKIPRQTSCHLGHAIRKDLRIDATTSTRLGLSAFCRTNESTKSQHRLGNIIGTRKCQPLEVRRVPRAQGGHHTAQSKVLAHF